MMRMHMLAPELLISLIVEEAEVASQSRDAETVAGRGQAAPAPARVREHRERYEMCREPAALMGWTHVQ